MMYVFVYIIGNNMSFDHGYNVRINQYNDLNIQHIIQIMSWLVVTLLFFVSGTIAIDKNLANEIFDDFKIPLDNRHDLLIASRNISREITKKYPFITPNGHIDKLNTTKARKCLGYFTTHHILSNSKHKLAPIVSKRIKNVYDTACGDTFEQMDALAHPKTATRHTLGIFEWSAAILETATGGSIMAIGVVVGFTGGCIMLGGPITLIGSGLIAYGINDIIKANDADPIISFASGVDDVIPSTNAIDTFLKHIDRLFV